MKYLMKITPLEAYSFGNDQNFEYPDEKTTGKESYFVRSKHIPEQTTVLGLVRYLILKESGLLRTDFNYSNEEREKMKEYIGEKSFSYELEEKQEFGYIKEISPVFILNSNNEILVRNPFHNTAKKEGYIPMKMGDEVETSFGKIQLPQKDEYDVKKGYANGYINLKTKEIVSDLFKVQLITGNRKNDKKEDNKDGFFKREQVHLKEGYCFGICVDAEKELPEKTIGYMGKKKTAFLIETIEVPAFNLEKEVCNCFQGGDRWCYALSDIVLKDIPKYEHFCIVEEKYQRNLETVYAEGKSIKRLKKSEIRYHLIKSGSVFYQEFNEKYYENPNAKQIGYNRVVKVGGN